MRIQARVIRTTRSRANKKSPRTAVQYNALPERSKDAYDRMIEVIAALRAGKGKSLTEISKEKNIDPRTVVRLGRSALKKVNGRYVAKQRDTLLRILPIPTPDGVREVAIRGSGQARTLGKYWAAIQKALRPPGDSSALLKFRGLAIKDASGTTIPLLTDLKILKYLARAGLLSFESLYRRGV